jgi:prepilin-type N-terminal cleavage/methylation domain-containing protein
MKNQKLGFTLIELLVVIVIIGILATISTATFSGFFASARDAKRQAAVQSVALIQKVNQGNQDAIDYSVASAAALETLLLANDYTLDPEGENCYVYGHLTADDSEFFIAVLKDDDVASNYFVDGTGAGSAAFTAADTSSSTLISELMDDAAGCTTGVTVAAYTTYEVQ